MSARTPFGENKEHGYGGLMRTEFRANDFLAGAASVSYSGPVAFGVS
jgi:hypothetical protein